MSSWLSSIWPSSSSQPSQSTPPSLPPQTPSAPPFTPTPPTPAEPSAPPPPPPTSLTAEEQGAFASWRNSLADFTGMGASSSDDPARTQERREWQSCEKMKQDALQNGELTTLPPLLRPRPSLTHDSEGFTLALARHPKETGAEFFRLATRSRVLQTRRLCSCSSTSSSRDARPPRPPSTAHPATSSRLEGSRQTTASSSARTGRSTRTTLL